jgi:uncharacterized protein YhaN
MRIERLELDAFGPFTGRVLDFASPLPGLHVVHGPNEAGKSSALRALQALLFGFPVRTGDNFIHPYDQLLVGGRLRRDDGSALSFRRRKKARNDLFDHDDNPLEADALTPFLHGLGQDVFGAMYGIDHDTLVRGGQGILDQQGEVGQALFAAGAGFASLKSILEGLEADADELFKPRATAREIPVALARYRELQGQLRAASLAGHEWEKHSRSLAEAEAEVQGLTARRLELDRELNRLERLRRALPYLGERRLLCEKLQAMGEVFQLPENFGFRRRELEENRRALRVRLEAAEGRLAGLRDRRGGLRINQAVLAHDGDIEDLHQRLGAYRKGLEDRPGLEGMRKACKIEAAHLLRRIRPGLGVEQAESLRPGLGKRRAVQDLARRHEAVAQDAWQAETRLAELRRELEGRMAELDAMGAAVDGSPLAQALGTARKAGDVDAELRARRADAQRAADACQAALERLGLWAGALEDVPALRLPLPETVNEFEEALRRADEELRRLDQEEARVVRELQGLTRELRAIANAAVVPSEADLAACRERREAGWGLLRRRWVDGEDVEEQSRLYDPDQPLPEAYELWVERADQTADRMYREADRVQKHAQLLAGVESAEAALAGLRADRESRRQARLELLSTWREHWSKIGIEPLGPVEMRAWLTNFQALRRQVEELQRLRADLADRQIRRRELRGLLLRELASLGARFDEEGDEFTPVLLRAESMVEALREGQLRRETLSRAVAELQAAAGKAEIAVGAARQQLEAWRRSWGEVMVFLGLPAEALPAEAGDYVDTLQECLAKLDEEEVLRKRIAGIDRDARAFEDSVRGLCSLVAPEEGQLEAALAVGRLKALLAQAVREQAVLARLEEDEGHAVRDVRVLAEELAVVEEGLAALRTEARAVDDEALVEAERRFAAWSELRRRLEEVESALARVSEGGALEDLESLAGEWDADALPGRIAGLRLELEEQVGPRLHELVERIGREKSELSRMDGGDAAARIADEMQEVLAGLGRMTDRYIRLKVAAGVLRAEIERYRAANQDPLLSIASDLFRDLTLNSFAGLRADIDDNDRPFLLGLRPGGERVRVEGMSSGTRDQLYLSLRLATLSWRSQSGEPMPFIVDDILVNFDEARSGATLRTLSDMADRTQIILFTHQAHIPDLARGLDRDDRVFVHEL